MNDNNLNQQDITPDEAAASLAFATSLSEGMNRQETLPEEPQDALEAPMAMENDTMPDMQEMEAKIEEMVSKTVKEEMKTLKEDIKQMLNEEG